MQRPLATRLLLLVALVLVSCQTQVSNPPDAPDRPLGPARGYIDSAYTFLAVAEDPDGDSLCYRFDWGDGDTSDWCLPTASGEGGRLAHTWQQPGTFLVRTQAQDRDANLSVWSIGYQVTIADTHPVRWVWTEEDPYGSPVIVEHKGETLIFFAAWEYLCAVDLDGQTRAMAEGMTNECFWPHPTYCAATGNIIAGNDEGELHAFTADLERSWHWPGNRTERTVDGQMWGTAAVRGETLYTVREEFRDRLHCFIDLGNAACLVNTFAFDDDEISGGPVIDHAGNVLVYDDIGRVYKFSPGLDSLLWDVYLDGEEPLGPAIGPDGSVYVGTGNGNLEALGPDGSRKWTTALEGGPVAGPVVGDAAVFAGTDDGKLCSVDMTDGSINWSVLLEADSASPDCIISSPLLTANGLVYALGDEALYCCRQADGELLWHTRLEEPGASSRDIMIDVPGSPTVLPSGDVLVPSEDEVLYCIAGDSAALLAQTSWPKWQHDQHNSGCAVSRP
jgi:outer membrane protein assembly factor BamB